MSNLVGHAHGQTKWNLPSAFPSDNYHVEALSHFATEIAKVTDGKLSFTIHASASLFKTPEIKRAVQTNAVQIGEVLISVHENEDPIFGLDVVPFLAASFDDARRLWEVQKPFMAKKLAAQGLMLLYGAPWPPQGIFAAKEIGSVADLKGSKWRAYNVGTSRIGEMVGAQPVTIQASELPQALAVGVVNAFITSAATAYDSKVWESISYFYDAQAWIPKNVVIVNQSAFDALDKSTQEQLLATAKRVEDYVWQAARDKTKWYVEQLTAKGMKVRVPGPQLADDLKRIGDVLTVDWTKRAGRDGEAIMSAFRRN
jgi:TRAP-type C4-dicarboxylate transport system substrate-binding protein